MNGTEFKFFVPMLKAAEGGDGRKRLHGVASSTVADRHGDLMSESALHDMLESANRGLTIFLNHSYNVPEDVAGTVEHASLRKPAADILDLSFDIIINDRNPRAVAAWDAIQNGTQLGLSIGAMIPDGGAKVDRKTGVYTIDHVDLVETSIVGVPANPRSWVEYAVKALRKSETVESPDAEKVVVFTGSHISTTATNDTIVLPSPEDIITKAPLSSDSRNNLPDSAFACPEKRKYPHHTASGAVDKAHLRNALARCGDPGNDQCGCAHIRAHAKALGMGEAGEKSFDELLIFALNDGVDESHFSAEAVEGDPSEMDLEDDGPVAEWPIEDNTGEPESEVSGEVAEPEIAEATVTVETPTAKITLDTGNRGTTPTAASTPSQDAPPSNPETETAAAEETPPWLGVPGNPPAKQSVDEADFSAASPLITASLKHATDIIASLTSELVEVKSALASAQIDAKEARSERDEAVREASKALTELDAILKRLANTPVGRKSVYHEAVGRYEAVRSVYGDDFAAMLARSNE